MQSEHLKSVSEKIESWDKDGLSIYIIADFPECDSNGRLVFREIDKILLVYDVVQNTERIEIHVS